jgi:hypothetical protein
VTAEEHGKAHYGDRVELVFVSVDGQALLLVPV